MAARKTVGERRAKKLSQLEKIKEELAKLEDETAARIGRVAVKAGLGEVAISDATLLKEFQDIAGRFRVDEKPATTRTGAAPQN